MAARAEARVGTLAGSRSDGPYNGAFKPNRTAFDWLSRDEAEVDKYVADPSCAAHGHVGLLRRLATRGGASATTDARSPGCDATCRSSSSRASATPSGHNGTGPRAVGEQYSSVGVVDVTCTLYPGARHEIFNETNRDEVTATSSPGSTRTSPPDPTPAQTPAAAGLNFPARSRNLHLSTTTVPVLS